MNYEALEGLVKSILASFNCGDCKSEATKNDVSVKSIEWNTINIKIKCAKCWKVSAIKSEVLSLDLKKLDLPKDQMELLKNRISKSNSWKISKINERISNNLISELNNDLKKDKINVSDLFLDN